MSPKTDNRDINDAGDEEQTITAPTPPQGQVSAGVPPEPESAEEREADREERMAERERAKERG